MGQPGQVTMKGETDRGSLLRDMKPGLNTGEYVFRSVEADSLPPEADPSGWFREPEGTTLILPRNQAHALGLSYSCVSAWIT